MILHKNINSSPYLEPKKRSKIFRKTNISIFFVTLIDYKNY